MNIYPIRLPRRAVSALAALVILASTVAFALPAAAQVRAGGIESISPSAARKGEIVTIKGHGFGAMNVRVTVGGIAAQVLSANGNQVIFSVPDGVLPGPTQVVATNPGFQSGSIGFRMLEGILLGGEGTSLLKDAGLQLLSNGVGSDQIQGTIILSRTEVRFRSDVTINEVNAVLQQINGGVIGIAKGTTFLTVAIPRQDSIGGLEALLAQIQRMPGVSLAILAQLPSRNSIFLPAPVDANEVSNKMRHLLPGRFPAAWNALPPAIDADGHCAISAIPLLIVDGFDASAPLVFTDGITQSFFQGPAPAPATFDPSTGDGQHGYEVAAIAASQDVGANPFLAKRCLDLRLIQDLGQDVKTEIDSIKAAMPGGKFIVNNSETFSNLCQGHIDTPCVPPQDELANAFGRGLLAEYWREQTKDRWSDFLMVVSAGNDNGSPGAVIYPGMGDSRFTSFSAISQLPDLQLNFVSDGSLWNPIPLFASAGFTSLVADPTQLGLLRDVISSDGLSGPDSIADNVIIVGSASSQSPGSILTQHVAGDQLAESSFSDRGPDVLAVGEDIFSPANLTGTSMAAPQIAGLASYLWMLSPGLNGQPALTKRAIVSNARNRVVDAYATVLSLDPAVIPTAQTARMRLTLLDVTEANGFNEEDVDDILRHLFVVAPDGTITHQATPGTIADFSRYDLNGDGFTTAGARRERFDLDRLGSVQFGASSYSTVSQNIEGQDIHFDETGVTDLEVLCYYAYSPMYTGNPDTRKSLLAGRCGLAVQPTTATINNGQHQQFTAVTPSNDTVTWSVTPGCGSIDQNGFFTGTTAGTCMVKAADNNDPNQVGEAAVTVKASGVHIALFLEDCNLQAATPSGFSLLVIDHKQCPGYAFSPGPPVPSYTQPNAGLDGTVADGVLRYHSEYHDTISPTDVANLSVNTGQIDLFASANADLIPEGTTTAPGIIFVSSGSSVRFAVQDDGVYRLDINGQISSNFAFLNTVTATLNCVIPSESPQAVSLDMFSGGFETPFSKPFSMTQSMARFATDPVTGQFLPGTCTLSLLAQAEISANSRENRTSGSEVKLSFTFTRIGP